MNVDAIRRLTSLNAEFYRSNGDSFARSRQGAWPGWDRACSHMPRAKAPCSVLDAACGTGRFERYAAGRFPRGSFAFTCIDACPDLFEPVEGCTFEQVDIVERLLARQPIVERPGGYDAAVSFGFAHHVPTAGLRERFLRALVETLAPSGIAVATFWRFADDGALAARARATTGEGAEALGIALGEGDYLVGWGARSGVYRYCHSFTADEIDGLAASVADVAEVVDRFDADGRNGAMNGYVVLRRHRL